MEEYTLVELCVIQIFDRYRHYKKLLHILHHDFNDFPYQSGNLVREKGSHSLYSIPARVSLEDEYNGYIEMCNKIINALEEDHRKIIINTYVLKKHKWWNDDFMSESTYYRRRKAAVKQFYKLYQDVKKSTDQ